jgi:hypothetical protein
MTTANINVTETGICYFVPDLDTWALSNEDSDGLLFEKELIHVGGFIKEENSDSLRFTVTEPALHHWKQTHDLMLANGVKVPIPIGHTTDPEKTRGELLSTRIGINSKNIPAVFGKIKFRDAEAAKLAKTADVSIYVTPDFTDGRGNKYYRPIRHVAITDYPVIPNLDKFQAIAASYDGLSDIGPSGHAPSKLLPLAQMLGVETPDQLDDATLTEQILGIYQMLKDKLVEQQGGDTDLTTLINPGGTTRMPATTQIPKAFAASFTSMLKDNRKAKLDALCPKHITPAVRDKFIAKYCGEDHIALSLNGLALSDEKAATQFAQDAEFDFIIETLKENTLTALGEKSGAQIPNALALSNPEMGIDTDENNVLTRDAEKRAKVGV